MLGRSRSYSLRARAPKGASVRSFSWDSDTLPLAVQYARVGSLYVMGDAAQSTLVQLAADTWGRAVQPDGTKRVHSLPVISNHLLEPNNPSSGAHWSNGGSGTITGGFTDPAGTTLGWRQTPASGSTTRYQTQTTATPKQPDTFQCWGKVGSGTAGVNNGFTGFEDQALPMDLTTAWKFFRTIDRVGSSAGTTYIVTVDGNTSATTGAKAAGARDAITAFPLYLRNKAWADVVPWFDDVTGTGTQHKVAHEYALTAGGFYDITFGDVWPLASAADQAVDGDAYLLGIDANNHVKFRASDSKFVVTSAGSVIAASPAQSYAAASKLTLRVVCSGTKSEIWINGALVASGSAGTAVASVPDAVQAFASSTGTGQFPCSFAGTWTLQVPS